MIRLTIHTINSYGTPVFPLKCHVLRFPVVCSMKDSEVEEELKKFKEATPGRTVIEWKKDIIRGDREEAMEMVNAQKPVDPDAFDEPL